jgi:hypothetical protein
MPARGAEQRSLQARRGLDGGSRLAALRRELHVVRRARRALARDRELPWFSYQCHFADVFARGGFDLVIGNPPWLRSEELPEEQRRRLSGRYRWWVSGGRGYANRPDLAVAFLERAMELAAPDGVVALLVPAKLATASYGSAARHALAATTTLLHVADLSGRPEAAFEATVYPLAVVARKSRPEPRHRVGTELTQAAGAAVPRAASWAGSWILVREPLRRALASLAREHPARRCPHLPSRTQNRRGHIFLDPRARTELVRHAVRGRDLPPFAVAPRPAALHPFTRQPAPLSLPPRAAAYLAGHADDYAPGATPGGPRGPCSASPPPRRITASSGPISRRLTAAAW